MHSEILLITERSETKYYLLQPEGRITYYRAQRDVRFFLRNTAILAAE